ncbi:MAG: hypothetical protein ACR2RB_17465 [Gammaproteobacteria bacterium]
MNDSKSVLVLARRDFLEAMRVAAGITVFGHHVALVFAQGVLEVNSEMEEFAELLELADIEPRSLYDDPEVPGISERDFTRLVEQSDFVINV